MSLSITPRQSQALAFIAGYIGSNSRAPSVREVAHALETRSISSVQYMLIRLEERGLIKTKAGRRRSIELVGEGA